jgi:hypothetical protein
MARAAAGGNLALEGGGASINRINNFRQILTNPC